jgi:hypothetical protein
MLSLSEIMFMAIVVYLLYRFIVNFLVPVMKAARQVREQFRNMQDQANGGGGPSDPGFGTGAGPGFRPGTGATPGFGTGAGAGPGSDTGAGPGARAEEKRSSGKPPAEDYIDFEEIK